MKDSVLEDLTDEDLIEEYEKSKNFNKKPLLLASAIILSLLMASYVYITYPTLGILLGLISSETVTDDTLVFRDNIVIFENNTLENIRSFYEERQRHEFPLCLQGEIEGSTYVVKDFYEPLVISQSFANVRHESCTPETIIHFHTHPHRRCQASNQDLISLRSQQEINPERGMLIMCEENRFSFYN